MSFTEIKDNFMSKFKKIFENIFGNYVSGLFGKPSNILFLGIDNSGKTTLVSKLKNNTNHIYLPTKHTVKEKIEIGNLTALVYDIGGHAAVRIAWKDYFYAVDGIVFIIDVYDEERFSEVKKSYETVCSLEQNAPILILMNKIDLLDEDNNSIKSKYEMRANLEREVGIDRNRGNIEVLYLSVLKENTFDESGGLRKGFSWLSEQIKKQEKNKQLQ